MILSRVSRKRMARISLVIWFYNIFTPVISYALTSGPAQPETQSFQPAGVSEMVDLTTGDFKYNIPLLDIGGYPLNLNYQSGVGIDDEASWVGLGWNLNVGAINRQLRGFPDDASGDEIKTERYSKPKITIGGKITGKVEVRGKGLVPNGSLSLGVFNDNYTGMGAEVGANAGISISMLTDGKLTAGLGLGVNSNTASGAGFDISPYASLAIKENKDDKELSSASMSTSLGYNSRSGMKSLTLGASYNGARETGRYFVPSYSTSTSLVTYNTEPVMPTIQVPYRTSYGSFTFDIGPTELLVFLGGGGSGYKSVSKIASETIKTEAYGFLYADRGKGKNNAVMDFTREKDNPIVPELRHIAIPVQLPDLFYYTSQSGSGQFRLFRGMGAFGDNEVNNKSDVTTAGLDIGIGGTNIHAGVSFFDQNSTTTTRRWVKGNEFLKKKEDSQGDFQGDFQEYSKTSPQHEPVYFKVIGEKGLENVSQAMKHNQPVAVAISDSSSQSSFSGVSGTESAHGLGKLSHQPKRTVVSYLTAEEAEKGALEKKLLNYPLMDVGTFSNPVVPVGDTIDRVSEDRKKHHISEITVTDDGGKRTVYGIPVYNKTQEEYSFAVGPAEISKGMVNVTYNGEKVNHLKGIDHYYHKETQPAYATSYLLTAILSPDYVDKTGNGISDDDNGAAIKFNYSKVEGYYNWRTPIAEAANKAMVNKGLLADPDDNKASIIYGQKELWYTHSIESKTHIAYFITKEREDALGVIDMKGALDNSTRQRCLMQVRLYSKEDLVTPVKVVKFDYGYELCPGVPNSINPGVGGKLTLKKVWFEYGGADKGKHHPYVFSYQDAGEEYAYLSTDRWGTYKPSSQNPGSMANDVYPYSVQNSSDAAANAGTWALNRIELPTGGIIQVNYESDDYAYVQNKRAAVMSPFLSLINKDGNSITSNLDHALINARGIKLALDSLPVDGVDQTHWFKNTYLNGSEYMYTKLSVKLATGYSPSYGAEYDYVPVYCKVTNVAIANGEAKVFFEELKEGDVMANPISIAAWQRIKNEYPRYAYRGFDNRPADGDANKGIERAVKAVISSIKNLNELRENFYQKANRLKFAGKYDHDQSFVRLVTPESHFKKGGGCRVKRVNISDNWQAMTGETTTGTQFYGQEYEYTKTEDGRLISSGVASYEPTVGGDENPLRQPVPYIQSIKGSLNNYFYLEEPFGESFYPGASVVYSKVTVRDLDASGQQADAQSRTGSVVNEFYTAREFPVRVEVLPLIKIRHKSNAAYTFLSSKSIDIATLSQGYSIELNDMHGKPKAVRVLNQSGSEISSTNYFYNTENTDAGEMRLKNEVTVVNSDATVSNNQVIGREIDFFTDMREQEANNDGLSIHTGVDIVKAGFIPIAPFLHWPSYSNREYKLFRSACAVKVAQYYGILDKVVKTQDGSSIATENVAYDSLTGEPLVTRTQNEFKQYVYNVNLPAYWVYKGMGGAYQNLGMIIKGLSTTSDGSFNFHSQHLFEGDEIYDVENQMKYWVINTNSKKRLINKHGRIQSNHMISTAKIIRSGYRNLLSKETSTLVCLENPIESGLFKLSSPGDMTNLLKVISANVNLYDEKWVAYEQGQGLEEDLTRNFSYVRSANFSNGYYAAEMYGNPSITTGNTYIPFGYWGGYDYSNNTNYHNRINDVGIWPEEDGNPSFGSSNKFGFDTVINVPASKTYYLALATNTSVRVNIDCQPTNIFFDCNNCTVYNWKIYPINLAQGKHVFNFNFLIKPHSVSDYGASAARFAAAELYDNNANEVVNANSTGTGLNILFTTKDLPGKEYVNSFFSEGNAPVQYKYTVKGYGLHACDRYSGPVKGTVNPYMNNFLGNWRLAETKVYQGNREYNVLLNNSTSSVQNKASGHINNYYNYWIRNAQIWDVNTSALNWISSGNITLYNRKGEELENRDALGRYSSALFSFNGELPNAVASNSRSREIFVNSFEDNHIKFNDYKDTAGVRHLRSVVDNIHVNNYVVATNSHTGRYSLRLEPGKKMMLATQIHNLDHKTENYLGLSDKNEYMYRDVRLIRGLYPVGFEPKTNSKYVFTAWIREPGYLYVSNVNNLNVVVNNNNVILKCKAIVEGWKLVEGIFTTGNIDKIGLGIESLSQGNEPLFIDDVRIHPVDCHVKSYVYNDRNFRLMAELDENNFAAFYEYDNEGNLIRVKKETERGIVTLKENRSSYRKK